MRGAQKAFIGGLVGIVLLAQAAVAGPAAAAATPTESITLSPVSKHYDVEAGQTFTDELTVVNDGTTDYDFIAYARPYSVKGEDYAPNFDATPENADAYNWVQFSQTRFHLDAGDSTKVHYTVRVPAGSRPGGHYGVLFVETQPPAGSSGSVIRKKRVGTILYMTVKGTYRLSGQVTSTAIPFLQNRAPLSAVTTVKNTGNTDFTDQTTYVVRDVLGRVKYQADKAYPVLPGTTRRIQLDWNQAPWLGLYHVTVKQQFLDQHATAAGYVLLVPRWLLIVLGLAIVGGAVYAILRRRR